MRRILLILFAFLLSLPTQAQLYNLFDDTTSKDFKELGETWERTYSITIDSMIQNGEVRDYFLGEVMNQGDPADFIPNDDDPDACDGWGGCFANSGSAGFGPKVRSHQEGNYHFYTLFGDTLRFDFMADSSVFYSNSDGFYALVISGVFEESVIGITQNVARYRIRHFSFDEQIIESPLNDFEIKVGESTGLISFFWVDEFPVVELPLTLLGSSTLPESLQALTSEMVYDYQVGDSIQYKQTFFLAEPFNPDFTEEITYKLMTILERVDETDSLRYTVQYDDETSQWTEELVYYRFDTLISLPFYTRINTVNTGGYHDASYQQVLFSRAFCQGSRTGLSEISGPYRQCELYDAWCGFDTDGPPEITHNEYVSGLGQYFHEVSRNGFGSLSTWIKKTQINFFSKGGESCGEQVILSSIHQEFPQVKVRIYPNPAIANFSISHTCFNFSINTEIRIRDIQGRQVAIMQWQGNTGIYDISWANSGIYFIEIVSDGARIASSKLVIQ